MGKIGRGIKDLFSLFTENISVFSRHMPEEEAVELGVKKLDLNGIFEGCEIIILAAGYTPGTHQMITKKQFEYSSLTINFDNFKVVFCYLNKFF